eukprot:1153089-Pelagomonas_calceolata.AAC.2
MGTEMVCCQKALNGSLKSGEAVVFGKYGAKVTHLMGGWPSLSLRRASLYPVFFPDTDEDESWGHPGGALVSWLQGLVVDTRELLCGAFA